MFWKKKVSVDTAPQIVACDKCRYVLLKYDADVRGEKDSYSGVLRDIFFCKTHAPNWSWRHYADVYDMKYGSYPCRELRYYLNNVRCDESGNPIKQK